MRATPIDIVVPVYNAAADLARCVDSVLEHSTGDWRLLLIDDASPDPAIRAYFSGLRVRRLLRTARIRGRRHRRVA
jgi:glycosyltransferase involved in cell wall biosynthesis